MGFAVFLGCCVPGMSYADSIDMVSKDLGSQCHSESSETTDSKSCKYDPTTAILDVKGVSFLKAKISLIQPGKKLVLHRSFFNEKIEIPPLFYEYSPPLVFKKEIPIYLEYSVFRV